MTVIITSFRESDELLKKCTAECFSVSRRQPKGYFYKELPCLSAIDKYGKAIKLRGRSEGDPLAGYKQDWIEMVATHDLWLKKWLKSLDNDSDICLTCWCPHSKATREQMRVYKTFVCHTLLIGRLINKYRPDIDLRLDYDHAIYGINEWKPDNFRIIL